MMKSVFTVAFMSVALLLSTFSEAANREREAKEAKDGKYYCPVAGMPELKMECGCTNGYCQLTPRDKVTADYQGGKLRFCCPMCVKMFKEAPAKYAVTANHQLVVTKQAKQIKCPLCGGDTDPKITANVGGVNVACASADCAKKLDASVKTPERLNLVFGEKAFGRAFKVSADTK